MMFSRLKATNGMTGVRSISMPLGTQLELRRVVLDWQDKEVVRIECDLASSFHELTSELDDALNKVTFFELFRPNKLSKKYSEPIYKAWVERETYSLIHSAQENLSVVVNYSLSSHEVSEVGLSNTESLNCRADITKSFVATGLGAVTIPTVVSMSTVSAGGLLGLFGATAVAWPVVIIGGLVIVVLFAFGGSKATKIKVNAIDRYKRTLHENLESQILGVDGSGESVNEKLQLWVCNQAQSAIMDIEEMMC
jgi:hypothetical protein